MFALIKEISKTAGISESHFTPSAFDALKPDHDGERSFEEFEKAFVDYMCSDAEDSTAVFGLAS